MVWALLDQGLSSLTNYLMLVLIIRSASIGDVGSYGLAYTGYFLAQAANRAVSVDPLTVRTSTEDRAEWSHDSRRALGAATTSSALLAALAAGCSVVVGGSLKTAFLALAVGLPFLLVQDTIRGILFADRRIRAATINDTLFLIAQAGAYSLLFLTHRATPGLLLLGWAFGAAIGVVAGFVQLRSTPSLRSQRGWVVDNRHLIPGYLADYLANRGAEQLTLVTIFSVASPATTGVVVAARTLFAPITTLQTGIKSYALPLASQFYRNGRLDRLRRFIAIFAGAMFISMLCAGIILEIVPDQLGSIFFGKNWKIASVAIWSMAIFSGINAAGFAIWVGCKATQRATSTFLGRLVAGGLTVGFAAAGVVVGGANGAILGMAGGAVVLVIMMTFVFRSGLTRDAPTRPIRAPR